MQNASESSLTTKGYAKSIEENLTDACLFLKNIGADAAFRINVATEQINRTCVIWNGRARWWCGCGFLRIACTSTASATATRVQIPSAKVVRRSENENTRF